MRKEIKIIVTFVVKCGEILKTNEYKYLGEWYNEKGNHSTSIKRSLKEKINYYIKQIKIYGNGHVMGKSEMLTKLKRYKTMANNILQCRSMEKYKCQ